MNNIITLAIDEADVHRMERMAQAILNLLAVRQPIPLEEPFPQVQEDLLQKGYVKWDKKEGWSLTIKGSDEIHLKEGIYVKKIDRGFLGLVVIMVLGSIIGAAYTLIAQKLF